MKISTKGRYALRLMLDLAMQGDSQPVSIKDISKRLDVSEKYLEQIIAMLNKAGYVKSIRGAAGGYVLKNEPGKYTVGMILRTTEGSLSPVDCVENGTCEKMSDCVTVMVWKKINDAVNNVVDYITLVDLMEWQKEKSVDYII